MIDDGMSGTSLLAGGPMIPPYHMPAQAFTARLAEARAGIALQSGE